MSGKSVYRGAIAGTVLALVALFAACVVVEEGPLPVPPGPQICTREYAPVCARRGTRVRTFGNACEANVADYQIIHTGECR